MSNIFVGDIDSLNQVPSYDTECFNNFVNELASDITASCMIPMNLPRAEVLNIVKRAKKWFYKHYEYSVQENFLYIPVGVFETQAFKNSRTLLLPAENPTTGGNEIYSVFGLREMGTYYGAGMDIDFTMGDFSLDRMLYAGVYGGHNLIEGAQNLEYYIINEKYFDMVRQILQNPISFHYSQLTHQLKFTGETPSRDVILEVYETVPECALFGDEIFFRYCSAKIKIALGNKLSLFSYTLPGNIQINADSLQSLGENELEAIIEEIKTDEGTDWMMHS